MNCPNCNAPLTEGQSFCGECGTSLLSADTKEAPVSADAVKTCEGYEEITTDATPDNTDTVTDTAEINLTVFADEEASEAENAENCEVSENPDAVMSTENAQIPQSSETSQIGESTENTDTADNFNINFSTEEEVPFEETQGKKKKKFKWGKFFLITIPALLVTAAIVLNIGWIAGFAIKLFGSPEAYLKFCEKKGMYDTVDTLGPIYENAVDKLSAQQTNSCNMSIEVSDAVISLLTPYLPEEFSDIDLSFLQNIKFNGTVTQDKFVSQSKLDLIINDVTIMGIDIATDLNNEKTYVGFPGLSDKYLLGEAQANLPFEEKDLEEIINIIKEIAPSKFQLGLLSSKYAGLAYECAEECEKESDKLEIGDKTQKVTKISFEVTEESFTKSMRDILEELKEDKSIKKFIETFQKEYEDRIGDTDKDFHDSFTDTLDDAIKSYDEDYTPESDTPVYVTDYINWKHEIIAREFEYEGESIFIGKVENKDDFNAEIRYNDEVILSGSGTDDGKFINGDFDLTIPDLEGTFKLSVKDFDLKALKKGYTCGTISITPPEEMFKAIPNEEISGLLSGMRLSLDINFNQNDQGSSSTISIKAMGQSLFTITFSLEEADFTKPVIPADNQCTNDPQKFSESINPFPLMNNLNKAGIPLLSIINAFSESES